MDMDDIVKGLTVIWLLIQIAATIEKLLDDR